MALAELDPPTPEEMQQASGETRGARVADANAPNVPNFVGKTIKDVMQEATATGIEVDHVRRRHGAGTNAGRWRGFDPRRTYRSEVCALDAQRPCSSSKSLKPCRV